MQTDISNYRVALLLKISILCFNTLFVFLLTTNSIQKNAQFKKPKVKSYDDMFRDKSYNSKQQFEEVSKQLQNYKCSNCPRTFNDLENLLPHLKNDHNVKLMHKCPKCSDSFNLKASLIRVLQFSIALILLWFFLLHLRLL